MKKTGLLLIQVFFAGLCFGQTYKLPAFKNTFSKQGYPKTAHRIEMLEHPVQYLGPSKDTILINRRTGLRPIADSNQVFIEDDVADQYAHYKNGKLRIIIDPSKQVTLEEYERWTKDTGYKYYKAYPILIINETDSITIVGEGANIPIILEALDKDKWWKPLETRYQFDCGVGLKYILLKPREILCVLAPKYTGTFKTKLRYRLGESYSAEFVGYISRDQFEFHGGYLP
ncbi:hypothetical protein A4H97_10535 [Niastella yeongjuensis]|uniref:Uncharacterized protein n=1 Tax=Niastella yeongjuensis TaxID=354355 RepID=A0A1V9EF90_9BACT|nr:hypothetical protein [Niastella yeongjuensis]OQP44790.1 hypothetical protein A4H97_10535 [Niastella yeongjuensis]SEP42392.1 hypothetical protein SAMN05660816_05993 [Niastella yeongjuensis]